jgi:methyl-accepting chemotaxis protein/CHASE3 domain sensor protein
MGNWTFGRKVGLGFAVAVIALIVIAIAGYRSALTLADSNERVAHTLEVRVQIAQVLTQLLNAETGQRGYVITGRDEFLAPYNTALGELDKAIHEVQRLTADNASQQQRIEQLRAAIDKKLAELKRVIGERRTSLDTATATIAAGEGREAMEHARALLADMDAEEMRLMDKRSRAVEDSTRIASSVIIYGTVAAVLAVLLVAWVIVSSLSRQLGGSARDLQSSSAELQAAANQQASGAAEQATAMAEIATTMSELLATSRQIAESSQRVAQIATETGGAARAGNAIVKRSNDSTTAVRRQVDQIVTHMLDLGKKAQQVGSVLDIVSELAEQTNILAINATIEAAGAGEAGRRFGVVAAEIRSLADRVGSSTKEIRTLIEDVRGAVNTTVMATEAGSKAVDASATSVTEMSTAFTQIASLVGTTSDAAREIELSTKQQASAVEQVNVAVTNAAQTTRETEASASQTLQTSGQLTKLSTELLQIVQAA